MSLATEPSKMPMPPSSHYPPSSHQARPTPATLYSRSVTAHRQPEQHGNVNVPRKIAFHPTPLHQSSVAATNADHPQSGPSRDQQQQQQQQHQQHQHQQHPQQQQQPQPHYQMRDDAQERTAVPVPIPPFFRKLRNAADLDEDLLQTDWFPCLDEFFQNIIEEAWSMFLVLKDQGMGPMELHYAFITQGFVMSPDDIKSWLRKYGHPSSSWLGENKDTDNECPESQLLLSYEAFRHVSATLCAFRPPRELWGMTFKALDTDQTDLITNRNLRLASDTLALDWAEEDIDGMIESADIDGKKAVNKEEFFAVMERAGFNGLRR